MASRSAALVVVLLVVLAGCAGSDGGPATTTAATPTTDAPTVDSKTTGTTATTATTASGIATSTSTPNDSSANASLPPGVNATGVEDAEALVGAHRRALNNTSFAFRFRANVSVGPASQWTLQRGTVGEGLSPLVVHSNSVRRFEDGTSSVSTDLWANGTAVVVRYRGENRTELRRYNRSGGNLADETWAHLPRADLDSQVTQSWLLELALTAGEYERVRTERADNRTMTVLRATDPVAAANYTDLRSTLRVDSAGRVHSLSLTATYEGDNETRIHYDFELTEVGNASVERPSWVGAATPPTTTENETATAAGNATTAKAETATTTTDR
ncbi:hypothetical protein M0R89_10645 [Halorussus limi]|uniref:Uncharacterized protein n=1 Tax=Halorussus limi TaxID=2938695 RepID=A0A8U0HQ66_9EURY|nr:hypothetical protein [Halorussus limi]UPV73007.1 hypothetical protein M0R89_10645 [Halorussus limi]